MDTEKYCIKKGTERWLPTKECRIIRDEALKSGRYAKGQIDLTSQKFTNGKNKADGYLARVWIQCGIHAEDESDIPHEPRKRAQSTVRLPRQKNVVLNGHQLLESCAQALHIDLAALVAKTAIWAPLAEHLACNGQAKYPHIRRAKSHEKRGRAETGESLDDNGTPNRQMKAALKKAYHIALLKGSYETCHVWPKTCYDTRYHTCFANLVMLPRSIAALSDHDKRVQTVLQYRAFELFGWHPEDKAEPRKPENYPTDWFDPNA